MDPQLLICRNCYNTAILKHGGTLTKFQRSKSSHAISEPAIRQINRHCYMTYGLFTDLKHNHGTIMLF